jgi:hypothetical protein
MSNRRKEFKIANRGGRVETLDNEETFNAIPQSHNSKDLPNKPMRQHYESWYNWLKEHPEDADKYGIKLSKTKTDTRWVGTFHKQMKQFITDFYVNGVIPQGRPHAGQPYGQNSVKINLNAFCHTLLRLDKKKYKEFTRPMWVQSFKIAITYEAERRKNKMTDEEKAHWVSWPDVIKARERYLVEWQKDQKNILRTKARTAHMYYLLLAFNTYIPPMRLDLVGMEVWREKKEPPRTASAYLWEKTKGKWAIVINHDKVSHHDEKIGLDRQIMELKNEIPGVTDGAKLNEIITLSMKIWPREYVLMAVKDTTTPMESTSYTTALKTTFKGRFPTQNILRKSYVSYWYLIKQISAETKNEIADRMRHSVEIAQRDYVKLDSVEMNQQADLVLQPVDLDVPVIFAPDPELDVKLKDEEGNEIRSNDRRKNKDGTYFNPADYMKEYRLKNKEKLQKQRHLIYEKKRKSILMQKILHNLNHDSTVKKEPSKQTKEIYGIKYSKKDKRWEAPTKDNGNVPNKRDKSDEENDE